MKNIKSLSAFYFNDLYKKNPDPWNFDKSAYEKAKYEQTMHMIPEGIYDTIFEIGCSNGALSQLLSQKTGRLLAVDSSSIAVTHAKERLADAVHVTVREMEVPREFPSGQFNLILLSEVGYFMIENDLISLREKMIAALHTAGYLLLVHWTPPVDEFPLTGDQVHELFLARCSEDDSQPLVHLKTQIEPQYRMDLLRLK